MIPQVSTVKSTWMTAKATLVTMGRALTRSTATNAHASRATLVRRSFQLLGNGNKDWSAGVLKQFK